MAWDKQYGLANIEIGNAVLNNTEPTPLTKVNYTKIGSAIYANTEGSNTDIKYEESDDILARLKSESGTKTLKWTTYENSLQSLALLEGGTYTAGTAGVGATYAPPENSVSVNKFVKWTNPFGGGVKMFNASITVVRNGLYSKDGVPELDVTATAQAVDPTYHSVVEFRAPVA